MDTKVRRIFVAFFLTIGIVGTTTSTSHASERPPLLRRSDLVADNPQLESWGALFYDRNDDSWPDLFVGHHLRFPTMMTNIRGTFVKDEEDALSFTAPGRRTYDRHSCAWGEANGDGRPDLYCVSGAQKGRGSGPNQLALGTSTGLKTAAASYGAVDLRGRGRTTNWIDFDMDGDLDIFVGNAFRKNHPNVMFENTGDGYRKASVGVTKEVYSRSSSWADWDANGYPDLLLTVDKGTGVLAYSNSGGRFVESRIGLQGVAGLMSAWGELDGDGMPDLAVVSRSGITTFRNVGGMFRKEQFLPADHALAATWVDLDNDGAQDLFVVRGAPRGSTDRGDLVYLREEGRFATRPSTVLLPSVGRGETVATADFDRDGHLDIVVTNGNARTKGRVDLLRNTTDSGRSVVVDLVGTGWNPDAFGAQVSVKAGDLAYRFQTNDGASYRAQSDVGSLILGIGDRLRAEIEVTWPDGSRDCVSALSRAPVRLKIGSNPC